MEWQKIILSINSGSDLKQHIAALAAGEKQFCLLDSQGFENPGLLTKNKGYSLLAAIGCQNKITAEKDALNELQTFFDEHGKNWYFGHLNYDLKNNIETQLHSLHADDIDFPLISFFIPEIVISLQEDLLSIYFTENTKENALSYQQLLQEDLPVSLNNDEKKIEFTVPSKSSYLEKINKIKYHLHRGDIYELNYCIPFFADNIQINPLSVWRKLSQQSPAPLSCFYRLNNKWLLSASPERFIRKENNHLISQPIKGTIKRSSDPATDIILKNELHHNEKERAENVMIVDLVRNDLSRIAERGSVKVEELFGIYSFPAVHQMISTVSATINENITFRDILKALFPMGSMTGAPKIRAMELIEELEDFKRGLFSGSVGYISPEGDFDFNVVIRSIFYNSGKSSLLVAAGSAITSKSDPELEYEECILKAVSLLRVLGCDLKKENSA